MPDEDTIEVQSVEVPEGTADLFDVGPVDVSPPVPEPAPDPAPTPEPVANWLPAESGIDLEGEVNTVIESAQANYHQSLAQDVQTGIAGVLNSLGVQQLPPALLQAVEQAPSFGGVVQTYMNFAAQVGYQAGMGKGGMDANKRTDADRIADKVRLTNEIKAQLVKDGWRQPVAPSLSGNVPPMADGDITEQEFKYAMENDQAYEQMMNGPKGEQMRKMFADAIGQSV